MTPQYYLPYIFIKRKHFSLDESGTQNCCVDIHFGPKVLRSPGGGMGTNNSRYNIRVVERTLNLIKLLADGKPRALTDISRELEISSSTVFRILATLVSHNFIQKDDGSGEYRLGISCLEMAGAFFNTIDIRQEALPELERLRDITSETVHLGLLDKMEVVYLEKIHGLHAIGLMSSRVGGRSPAYCTGLGKALLAYEDPRIVRRYFLEHGLQKFTSNTITEIDALMKELDRIRTRGYALDEGEHEEGVRCVAVPIVDFSYHTVAAISISGPSDRLDPFAEESKMLRWIQESADVISKRMGHPGKEAAGVFT